ALSHVTEEGPLTAWVGSDYIPRLQRSALFDLGLDADGVIHLTLVTSGKRLNLGDGTAVGFGIDFRITKADWEDGRLELDIGVVDEQKWSQNRDGATPYRAWVEAKWGWYPFERVAAYCP